MLNDIANIMTVAKMRYWDNARYYLILHRKFCGFGTELLSNTVIVKNNGSSGVDDFLSGSTLRKSLTPLEKIL